MKREEDIINSFLVTFEEGGDGGEYKEKDTKDMNHSRRNYEDFLIGFHKARKEFRNEKLLIFFILNFLFLSLDTPLENISIM